MVFLFAFIRIFEIKINMGFNFSMSFGKPPTPTSVERNVVGEWFYRFGKVDGTPEKLGSIQEKVKFALNSPVFMSPAIKVMDLASQVNVQSLDAKGNVLQDHALHHLMERPNITQSWTEFIASTMLYAKMGMAVIYIPNGGLSEDSGIHCLKIENIVYDKTIIQKLASFVGLKAGRKYLQDKFVKYRWDDGTTSSIFLKDLHLIGTLPNGLKGNLFDNLTLVDVLYKILVNSNEILDTDYTLTRLAQKVMIGTKSNTQSLERPMDEPEKVSIEDAINSRKKVTATNKDIKANRLVTDKGGLQTYEAIKTYVNMAEDMLGVSPDIGAFGKSTFNNQELATGRTIEFAVKPILEKLIEIIKQNSTLTNLRLDFSHMSFNQVFEEMREKKNDLKLKNIVLALEKGLITQEQAQLLTKEVFAT